MNHVSGIALRGISRLLGACLLVLLSVAVVQLVASVPADAQDGGSIDAPMLSAERQADGSVVVRWGADASATRYRVATSASTTTCSAVGLSSATCESSVGGDVCVAVQGEVEPSLVDGVAVPGRQGLASDWLCASGDFLLLEASDSYPSASVAFAVGTVANNTAVPAVLATRGFDSCVVDLAYYPARYMCVPQLALDDLLEQLGDAPRIVEYVIRYRVS